MDKGLRRLYRSPNRSPLFQVSILGLVDKGLRLSSFEKIEDVELVSILGLVDKGLRPLGIAIAHIISKGFNPWFSG